ncbi:MAG: prolipoprotein diacylglyceryl transferase [Patescibacteria group bacterium]
MLPILLEIGFIKVYTFGIFLVLAFFWGCFFLWKNIRLTSYKEEEVFDGLFFALIIGGFIGRLTHVVLNFSDFGLSPIRFILINGYPGFSLLGFLLGILLGFAMFVNTRKIRFQNLIDYVVPPLFLAVAIGKLGSFFSGVEIGTETTLPVAIQYANYDGMRHLTPLYESIIYFLGSYLSFKLLFSVRRDILDNGFLLSFFIWFTSAVVFAFDWIREDKMLMYGYSVYGILAMFLLLTFSLYFIYYFRTALLQPFIGNSHKKNYGKSSQSGVRSKPERKAPRRKKENNG